MPDLSKQVFLEARGGEAATKKSHRRVAENAEFQNLFHCAPGNLSPLENHLQSELYLPRYPYGAGDRSRNRRADRRVGQIELRGIGQIEELGPKLHTVLFGDPKILEDRKIEVRAPGSVKNV